MTDRKTNPNRKALGSNPLKGDRLRSLWDQPPPALNENLQINPVEEIALYQPPNQPPEPSAHPESAEPSSLTHPILNSGTPDPIIDQLIEIASLPIDQRPGYQNPKPSEPKALAMERFTCEIPLDLNDWLDGIVRTSRRLHGSKIKKQSLVLFALRSLQRQPIDWSKVRNDDLGNLL